MVPPEYGLRGVKHRVITLWDLNYVDDFKSWDWKRKFQNHGTGIGKIKTMELEEEKLRPWNWKRKFQSHEIGRGHFKIMVLQEEILKSWYCKRIF